MYNMYYCHVLSNVADGCDMPDTCSLHDLATSQTFTPHELLGTWELVARSTPEGVTFFRSFTIKFGFESDDRGEYIMTGKRRCDCSNDVRDISVCTVLCNTKFS